MSIDFPRAWQLAKSVELDKHDTKCSYRVAKGGLLCDCEVLTKHQEYISSNFYGKDGVIITARYVNQRKMEETD